MAVESVRAFLSIAEFLQRVPIKRTAFYAAVKRGDIRVVRIGGRTLIPTDEIERLVRGTDAA